MRLGTLHFDHCSARFSYSWGGTGIITNAAAVIDSIQAPDAELRNKTRFKSRLPTVRDGTPLLSQMMADQEAACSAPNQTTRNDHEQEFTPLALPALARRGQPQKPWR